MQTYNARNADSHNSRTDDIPVHCHRLHLNMLLEYLNTGEKEDGLKMRKDSSQFASFL